MSSACPDEARAVASAARAELAPNASFVYSWQSTNFCLATMRNILVQLSTALAISTNCTAACDVAGAVQLQSNMAQLASWKEKGDAVEVTWNDIVLQQSAPQRRQLVEAFANTDACIKGRARDIRFYGHGRLIGVASPSTGISMIDPAIVTKAKPIPPARDSLAVRGHAIKVGMNADDVFAILKKSEMVDQQIKDDPTYPGSLRLTKRYNADGKRFTLVFSRTTASGPYEVTSIIPSGN